MKITEKTYSIDGAEFIQRPLSPFQMLRLVSALSDAEQSIKDKFTAVIKDEQIEIDLTDIINYLEADGGVILTKLVCAVLIDPVSNKPVYLADADTQKTASAISAETLLEVVADFFILNNVSKIASSFLKIAEQSRRLSGNSASK